MPSLRARKPGASEKVALDIAFLATPVVSFGMPFITKVRSVRVRVCVWCVHAKNRSDLVGVRAGILCVDVKNRFDLCSGAAGLTDRGALSVVTGY